MSQLTLYHCDKTPWPKATGEGVYFSLQVSSYTSQGSKERNPRYELWGRSWIKSHREMLPTGLFLTACSDAFFFHTTQEHLPWYGMDCECNVTSTSINNQKKKKNAQQVNLCVEGGFQLGPLFPMTIACIELTKHWSAHQYNS